jgi:ribosomal protein S18 acetylase RimI-like enzyme
MNTFATACCRRGCVEDAPALAALHVSEIHEGFLASLGEPFLTRLYRRIMRSETGTVFVAALAGEPVAFAAGATDVGRLYKEFLLRDGFVAGCLALPHLLPSARKVVETLRYPTATGDLPRAEVLSVATSAGARGRGLGSATLRALLSDLAAREVDAVKVTLGTQNDAALAMYRSCGFSEAADVRVHRETPSKALVCRTR